MRVAVISGGRSSEHEISLQSGASVAAGLREAGHEVVEVLIERDGRWTADGDEVELRAAGGLLGCDVAFPVLHGPFGEDGTVQGMLECLDVAYAGPSVLAAAVAIDKLVCKRLLAFDGLPQVDFGEVGEPGWRERVAAMATAAVGEALTARVQRRNLARCRPGARARRGGRGGPGPRPAGDRRGRRRRTGGRVLGDRQRGIGDDASIETSLPGAIVTKASDWYDFEAKYAEGGMELVVPAPIGDAAIDRVRELAAGSSARSAAPGSRAATSSSATTARCWSTRSTRSPASPRPASSAKLFEATGVSYAGALRSARRAGGGAPPARARVPVLAPRDAAVGIRRRRSGPLPRSRRGIPRRRRRAW